MPIRELNSKSVKFTNECKKYDGKKVHVEAYERFILDILKPKKYKLGISTEQIKKGMKPETYMMPQLSIEKSWCLVDSHCKKHVIELVIDLCNRYDSSVNKKIPIIMSGTAKCFVLNRRYYNFIFELKNFLIKNNFIAHNYYTQEIDSLIDSIKLEPNDISDIVNEMMIFSIEDI